MRLINSIEMQQVSGGVGLSLLFTFASGLQGYDFGKTVLFNTIGSVATLGFSGSLTSTVITLGSTSIGLPACLAASIALSAVEGCIGYGLGTLFAKDPQ